MTVDVGGSQLSTIAGAAALYEREHAAMVRLARLLVSSSPLADEMVHDAFVTVLERWAKIDDPGAYLRQVVVNNCRGAMRRSLVGRRKYARLALLESVEPQELPHEVDETWKALDLVTPKQRMALVLRYYLDLPVADVAELMGERSGTVKSLVHRGLSTLRQELSP